MEDIVFEVKGFWLPDEVAALAGFPVECSTSDDVVVVHPRPRELSKAEIDLLKKVFAAQAMPTAQARFEVILATEKSAADARRAKVAEFKAKAAQGKVSLPELTEMVLELLE